MSPRKLPKNEEIEFKSAPNKIGFKTKPVLAFADKYPGLTGHYWDDLYLASPFDLMVHLCALPESVNTVLVVGHNPGVSELAASFSRQVGLLGTAGMALLDIEITTWPDLASFPSPSYVDWSDKLA